jgi:hypothetical protein
VDVALHEGAERSIDHAVTLQRFFPREMPGPETYSEVTSAVSRTSVTRVAVAVVDDVELLRLKRCLEPTPNRRDAVRRHGLT